MGAGQSTEEKTAFHVLKVVDNSPASAAQLDPYFDYIVAVNDTPVIQETPNIVAAIAKENIGKSIKFTVFSSKNELFRDCHIIPSDNWGGVGLLGCSIRFCSYDKAAERVWHVLNVHPNSPASRAQLIPNSDYILGCENELLMNNEDLGALLSQRNKIPIKMIIFNCESGKCREVEITPDSEWGGVGSLGCDVGYGILHKIPSNAVEKSQIKSTNLPEIVQPHIPCNHNHSHTFEEHHQESKSNFVEQPIEPAMPHYEHQVANTGQPQNSERVSTAGGNYLNPVENFHQGYYQQEGGNYQQGGENYQQERGNYPQEGGNYQLEGNYQQGENYQQGGNYQQEGVNYQQEGNYLQGGNYQQGGVNYQQEGGHYQQEGGNYQQGVNHPQTGYYQQDVNYQETGNYQQPILNQGNFHQSGFVQSEFAQPQFNVDSQQPINFNNMSHQMETVEASTPPQIPHPIDLLNQKTDQVISKTEDILSDLENISPSRESSFSPTARSASYSSPSVANPALQKRFSADQSPIVASNSISVQKELNQSAIPAGNAVLPSISYTTGSHTANLQSANVPISLSNSSHTSSTAGFTNGQIGSNIPIVDNASQGAAFAPPHITSKQASSAKSSPENVNAEPLPQHLFSGTPSKGASDFFDLR